MAWNFDEQNKINISAKTPAEVLQNWLEKMDFKRRRQRYDCYAAYF